MRVQSQRILGSSICCHNLAGWGQNGARCEVRLLGSESEAPFSADQVVCYPSLTDHVKATHPTDSAYLRRKIALIQQLSHPFHLQLRLICSIHIRKAACFLAE